MTFMETKEYRKAVSERCAQVVEMAEKCRAWQQFLCVTSFSEIGADIGDQWYSWDEFNIQFPDLHDQNVLRKAIDCMLRGPHRVPDDPRFFKRQRLFDKMAYASVPLNWFVETTADCKVTFSLPLPMTFAVSSFRMKRTHKVHQGDNWWGRLYLHDGRISKDYKEHEVAERIDFPCETTRDQIFEELLNKVRESEEKYLFTITSEPVIAAMIKVESDLLLTPE